MKRLEHFFLLSFFLLLAGAVKSQTTQQIQFTYDAAGNRIKRTLITVTPGGGGTGAKSANPSAGINKVDSSQIVSMNVYPNPAQDHLHVEIASSNQEINYQAILFDVNGRLIQERKINSAGIHSFDVSALSVGNYFLKVFSDKEERSWNVMKQ